MPVFRVICSSFRAVRLIRFAAMVLVFAGFLCVNPLASSQDKEQIIRAIEEYKDGIRGYQLTIKGTLRSSANGSKGTESSVHYLLTVSESGETWVFEQLESDLEATRTYRFSARYHWNGAPTFSAKHNTETVVDSHSGKDLLLDNLHLEYDSSWNPLFSLASCWSLGADNNNGVWLLDALRDDEDYTIERNGSRITCNFKGLGRPKPDSGEQDLISYSLIFEDNNGVLDMLSIDATSEFKSISNGAPGVSTNHVRFGETLRDGNLTIIKTCTVETEITISGQLPVKGMDEFTVESSKPRSIPEKLYFENIKIPGGQRVVSRSPVRYEYHEGEIFKMADDRSLKSLDGVRTYTPSFWRKFGNIVLVFVLLLIAAGFFGVRHLRRKI